jgi:hypothetical protein
MFQAPMDQGQRYDVGVRVPSGDLSWGDLAGLRQLFGLDAHIPNVEADPRRKLPGGQSSPQSLRGMASIVCRYGKVRVDELSAGYICGNAHCAIARNWTLRPWHSHFRQDCFTLLHIRFGEVLARR